MQTRPDHTRYRPDRTGRYRLACLPALLAFVWVSARFVGTCLHQHLQMHETALVCACRAERAAAGGGGSGGSGSAGGPSEAPPLGVDSVALLEEAVPEEEEVAAAAAATQGGGGSAQP